MIHQASVYCPARVVLHVSRLAVFPSLLQQQVSHTSYKLIIQAVLSACITCVGVCSSSVCESMRGVLLHPQRLLGLLVATMETTIMCKVHSFYCT